MTNTMADIPYWSMVPSFTSDPNERNIIATIARTFSGLGQGIISILTPVMLPILSVTMINGEKVADSKGYSTWAIICAIALIGFSSLSVSQTKERVITASTSEKFSFKKIFKVLTSNDQLRIFMVFAMLSNAGYYMISGVGVYFFDVVVGDPSKQSTFNLIGAVGSVLGLAVVPVLTKFISRKRTYQTSLCLVLAGFIGMLICAKTQAYMIMNFCYLLASIGVASMFVSQTVFLADIVDYGEIKMGNRAEAITFSMKGFLQKMAYTMQTIVLFGGLGLMKYNDQIASAKVLNDTTKTGIGIICFGVPMLFFLASLVVFRNKFKVYGELADKVHDYIIEKRASGE
jgi:melibiose permease